MTASRRARGGAVAANPHDADPGVTHSARRDDHHDDHTPPGVDPSGDLADAPLASDMVSWWRSDRRASSCGWVCGKAAGRTRAAALQSAPCGGEAIDGRNRQQAIGAREVFPYTLPYARFALGNIRKTDGDGDCDADVAAAVVCS